MKYLVNRETKEHVAWQPMACSSEWKTVEADAEGWIKWEGGECPLPENYPVALKFKGNNFKYTNHLAGDWLWEDKTIEAYRPILDKPEVVKAIPAPEYDPRSVSFNVLKRLEAAHEAAQTIPDLEAELREELGKMGYDLVARSPFVPFTPSGEFEQPPVDDELTKNITVYFGGGHTEPDMSDWRNWREGDWLMCIKKDNDHCDDFVLDEIYELKGMSMAQWVCCKNPTAKHQYNELPADHFRFHSRPEVKS